jgi:hypothetical protein
MSIRKQRLEADWRGVTDIETGTAFERHGSIHFGVFAFTFFGLTVTPMQRCNHPIERLSLTNKKNKK